MLYNVILPFEIVLVLILFTIMPFQKSSKRPFQTDKKKFLKDPKLAAPFSHSISRVPLNAFDRPAFPSRPFLRFFDRSYIPPTWPHLSYWFKLRHPRLLPSFHRTHQPILLYCFLIGLFRSIPLQSRSIIKIRYDTR